MTEGESDSSSDNERTQQRLRVSSADQNQDLVFTKIVFGLIRRVGSVGRLMDDGIYFMEQMWHRRSSGVGISGKRCYGALLNREKERRTCILLALEFKNSPKTSRLPFVAVVPGSAFDDA